MRPRQINLRRHPQSPDTPLVHPLNSIDDSLASFPRQIDRSDALLSNDIISNESFSRVLYMYVLLILQ